MTQPPPNQPNPAAVAPPDARGSSLATRVLGAAIGGFSGALAGIGLLIFASSPLPIVLLCAGLITVGVILGARSGPRVWRAVAEAFFESAFHS